MPDLQGVWSSPSLAPRPRPGYARPVLVRRRRSAALRFALALRVVSAFLAALVLGQSALAAPIVPLCAPRGAPDACCDETGASGRPTTDHDDADGDQERSDDHDAPCSCPFGCHACCGRAAVRAVPALALELELRAFAASDVSFVSHERTPPRADPSEILHVPRPAGA